MAGQFVLARSRNRLIQHPQRPHAVDLTVCKANSARAVSREAGARLTEAIGRVERIVEAFGRRDAFAAPELVGAIGGIERAKFNEHRPRPHSSSDRRPRTSEQNLAGFPSWRLITSVGRALGILALT